MDMQCRYSAVLWAEYLKDELPADEMARIRTHLGTCSQCREKLNMLRQAYDDMGVFPTYSASLPVNVIAENARRTKFTFIWWRYTLATMAAGLMVCLGVFWQYGGRQSDRLVQRTLVPPQTAQNSPSITFQPSVRMTPSTPAKALCLKNTSASVSMRQSTPARPGVILPSTTPSHEKEQPSLTSGDGNRIVPEPDMLTQHVEVLSKCLAAQEELNTPLRCAVLPVVPKDDADFHAADTLTAALVYGLVEQNSNLSVTRLAPLVAVNHGTSDITDQASEIARLADTTPSDYLIIGTVEAESEGYLLSVSVMNRKDESIIYRDQHPVLLPHDTFTLPKSPASDGEIGEVDQVATVRIGKQS